MATGRVLVARLGEAAPGWREARLARNGEPRLTPYAWANARRNGYDLVSMGWPEAEVERAAREYGEELAEAA